MRLVDLVASANKPVGVELRGQRLFLPGAASFSRAVSECPLRYVLEGNVQDAMETLLSQWPDLLKPSDTNLRVPAQSMWLEWQDKASRKYGILLESAPNGRSGSIRSFWDNNGGVDASQVSLEFDLDSPAVSSAPLSYALSDLHQPILDLDSHIVVRLDDEWRNYFLLTTTAVIDSVRACLNVVWPDIHKLFSFSRILSSRIELVQRPVTREKINVARAKSNKQPLLDHIELYMSLEKNRDTKAGNQVGRSASRLHIVRGHLVRKGDKIFWRSTHLRGETGSAIPVKRTTIIR